MGEVSLLENGQEKWYTIEQIAELCGYEVSTLKYGEKKSLCYYEKRSVVK